MAKVNVSLTIKFDMKDYAKSVIETNMNRSGVEEVLECWLSAQIGQGKDERQAIERDVYTVSIGVDLSDDTFFTKSDTGNKSLTCGLVQWVFSNLDTLML